MLDNSEQLARSEEEAKRIHPLEQEISNSIRDDKEEFSDQTKNLIKRSDFTSSLAYYEAKRVNQLEKSDSDPIKLSSAIKESILKPIERHLETIAMNYNIEEELAKFKSDKRSERVNWKSFSEIFDSIMKKRVVPLIPPEKLILLLRYIRLLADKKSTRKIPIS